MQEKDIQHFETMKQFLDFNAADVENLVTLAPLFATHGPAITDRFYTALERNPDTAPFLEGRVESLKSTHHRWMAELFSGEYGVSYLESRFRIGRRHVEIGLNPSWVEAVMSVLRTEGMAMISQHYDQQRAAVLASSLFKILDIDLYIINRSYAAFAEERLLGLAAFTGMNRKLLDNLMKKGMGAPKPAGGS